MGYLDYITCLRNTILVQNPRYVACGVNPFAFSFSATKTPSRVQISSVNERGRTVPEHAFMNEPGQTSGAAAVQLSDMLALT